MKTLKGLIKSKTFWLNVVGGILQIINAGSGHWISVEIATSIQAVLNIGVRLLTNKAIVDK